MLTKLGYCMLLSNAQKIAYYAFEKCPLFPKLCYFFHKKVRPLCPNGAKCYINNNSIIIITYLNNIAEISKLQAQDTKQLVTGSKYRTNTK